MVKIKGVGYTLFVFITLSLLITYIIYTLSSKIEYTSTYPFVYKGYTLREIKDALERDFPRSVDIAVKRSLLIIINNETYEGRFYTNPLEILNNLSLSGVYAGFDNSLISGNSINDWVNKYKAITTLKGINVNIEVKNYTTKLVGPLTLRACYNLTYNIQDVYNEQGYKKSKISCSDVYLENFEDPYITIKSYENLISNMYLCDNIPGNQTGNEFYGIAYKPSSNDLGGLSNKEDYILVVENISEYSNYGGFRGYVLGEKPPTGFTYSPYIYDVNISRIENNTFIGVSHNKVWITHKHLDESPTTCYFSWNEGMSLLDRLKGEGNSEYSIATIISLSYLPPEINPGGKYALDVEVFKQ